MNDMDKHIFIHHVLIITDFLLIAHYYNKYTSQTNLVPMKEAC